MILYCRLDTRGKGWTCFSLPSTSVGLAFSEFLSQPGLSKTIYHDLLYYVFIILASESSEDTVTVDLGVKLITLFRRMEVTQLRDRSVATPMVHRVFVGKDCGLSSSPFGV